MIIEFGWELLLMIVQFELITSQKTSKNYLKLYKMELELL